MVARRSSRAPALRRLAGRVLETSSLQDLAQLLTRELPALAGAESATLLLWNRRLDSFEALTPGETHMAAVRPGTKVAAPEAGFLLTDGHIMETPQGGGEGVLVPLMARSGLVGMLVLGVRAGRRRVPFREPVARVLTTLAARAALAIENHVYLRELVQSERMAALGTMAGMLAHDLRTPMTVIRGYAEMLAAGGASPDEVRTRAATIVEMVDRLDRMTEDTLDFARAGGRLSRRSVTLDELAGEVLSGLERELPGLAVVRHEGGPLDGSGSLDTDKLRRAVFNIAGNAREAMGGTGRLHVSMQRETAEGRDLVVLWLADEGPGIPASIRATLFDAFVTAGKKNGTGLGLAVTRRFVEDQGGTVELADPAAAPFPETSGACFCIRIPLLAAAPGGNGPGAG